LVEEVARGVQHLLFVLNKADRLSETERREARVFAERVVAKRLGRPVGPVLEVSAVESLGSARPTGELSSLQDSLTVLAREAGADLVASAQVRGLERLSGGVLATLAEQREALVRPLEDSERRIETLRHSVEEAKRAAGDLSYLFMAEQNRLSEAFTSKKEEFLARAIPAARQKLEAELADDDGGLGLRGRASALARDIARRTLGAWLPEVEPVSEQMYRQAMQHFVEIANQFLERLSDSDASYAALPARSLEAEAGFRTPRRFYFNDLFELAPSAARVLALLRGTRAVTTGAGDYLQTLLEHNATRVVNDLDERVLESRRHLEAEISRRLQESLEAAVVALERARARRLAGQTAVQQEIARIETLESRVRALLPPGPQGT
jgi:polyhydroxyalkanoate synthesis regulator phasin